MKHIFISLLSLIIMVIGSSPALSAILVQSTNGTYTTKTNLAAANTAADAAGKRIKLTGNIVLTSNLALATDRYWDFTDATITTTGYTLTCTGADVLLPDTRQVFAGTGSVVGLSESIGDAGTWEGLPINTEAQTFINRVEADGGVVSSPIILSGLIDKAKEDGYYNNLVGVYSPEWGSKGVATASKLYSLTGEPYDLMQSTIAYQPDILASVLSTLPGKQTIRLTSFSKNIQRAFTFNQPMSIVSVIRQRGFTATRVVFSGAPGIGWGLFQHLIGSEIVYAAAPSVGPSTRSSFGYGWRILTAKFDGNTSDVRIDEIAGLGGGGVGSYNAGGFAIGAAVGTSADIEVAAVVIINTSEDAKINALRDDLNSIYGIYGSKNRLVFDGDSLTAGIVYSETYPNQAMSLITGSWDMYNTGSGGYGISSLRGRGTTTVDGLYNATVAKNVVVVWGGTNDLVGVSAQSTYDTLRGYCEDRRARGWKVVVLSMLPRQYGNEPADFEERRTAFNVLLDANHNFADAYVPLHNNTVIGDADDCLNTTYYFDKLHMTAAGYGVVAAQVAPVVNALP